MSNTIANLQPADFAGAMQTLPPRGDALPRDPNALFATLLAGLSGRMAAVHAQAALLSEVESDPRQATLLLPDWEACLGLPDPCLGPAPNIGERRSQVAARFSGRGGVRNAAFYIAYAATLGYAITITTFPQFRAGSGRAGQHVRGSAWAFAWQINAPSITVSYFRAGAAAAGDSLRSLSSQNLTCEMQRIAHAETMLLFNFGISFNFQLPANSQFLASI